MEYVVIYAIFVLSTAGAWYIFCVGSTAFMNAGLKATEKKQ